MGKRVQRRINAACAVVAIGSAIGEAIENGFTTPSRFDAVFWPSFAAYWCLLWWLAERRRTR